MLKNRFFIFISVAVATMSVSLSSCTKEDLEEKNSLTADIRRILPADMLAKLKALGLEINDGNNPPDIEGTYLCSPWTLVKSNFADEFSPGFKFNDKYLTFSQQNNNNLTVMLDYAASVTQGSGTGAFITGQGNKFSIFVEISGVALGSPYKTVEVYSGEISSSGIKNLYEGFIVTLEAPATVKKGQARLIRDNDGLAERVKTPSLSVPTNVRATQSGTSINVTWNSVSGATSYEVFRSSSSSGTYSSIGTTTTTSRTHSNPSSGANYYKVAAKNASSTSDYSSYASCNYSAPVSTGTISFWTTESKYGTITVTLTGHGSKQITSRYTTSPGCGASGCASFTSMPYGSYSYSVTTNTGATSSGKVDLASSCFTVLLY